MRHVSHNHQLLLPIPLEGFLEIRPGESAWMVLVNDRFPLLRLEFCKLFRQRGVGCKDGRAFRRIVQDVYDGCGCRAELFEQFGNGGAAFFYAFRTELAIGVSELISTASS